MGIKKSVKEVCEEEVIHPKAIARVMRFLPTDAFIGEMAEFYKAFSSPTRVKILSALSVSELCVCDLAYLLKLTPSAVSHQLGALRSLRLVKFRRQGKQLFYSLDDAHINKILSVAEEHLKEK